MNARQAKKIAKRKAEENRIVKIKPIPQLKKITVKKGKKIKYKVIRTPEYKEYKEIQAAISYFGNDGIAKSVHNVLKKIGNKKCPVGSYTDLTWNEVMAKITAKLSAETLAADWVSNYFAEAFTYGGGETDRNYITQQATGEEVMIGWAQTLDFEENNVVPHSLI